LQAGAAEQPAVQFHEASPVTVETAGQKRHIWIGMMAKLLGAIFVGLFMAYLAFEARLTLAQPRGFSR
jgi:hypothetical protein